MPEKEWMVTNNLNLKSSHDLIMYLSHLSAYKKALEYVKDKDIVEIGCGSGYGIKYLSNYAKSITTVDRDQNSLNYAKKEYYAENITYVQADATSRLPFNDNIFDLGISFQVIEHIPPEKMDAFLSEFKRIVKPDGYILFTTPNRDIRLQPFQKPRNPYHRVEYSHKSFNKLLLKHFRSVEILGLRSVPVVMRHYYQLKQTPFQAYIKNPLRDNILWVSKKMHLKKIQEFLDSRSEKGKLSASKGGGDTLNLTLDDFEFTKDHLSDSIHFLAICKN